MKHEKGKIRAERGAGLFEYIILVAIISIVVIAAVKSLTIATYRVTMKNADAIACSGSIPSSCGP